ncbi:MAG: NADH-quinone oxidoreductase subunit H [Solirubrobacteraceae bacterium]|nr:NADH-quinone oxidoreductase subunit H [Solirubrobacteraceae bacterium]
MTAATAAAGAVQLLGCVAVAPLLPGTVQHLKARLQGRPGPSPLQPYRELRRLWRKSGVAPQPRTVIYELAPATVAGTLLIAALLVPIGGHAPDWGIGHDALVLVGLLALGRFAIALAAWDTGGAFGLIGAARDLTFAVPVEAVLLLVVVVLALPSGSTDLLALSALATTAEAWSEPAHWAAALAFGIVVLAELGRQPVDNPDTHLELTMVHEGPLLEYAGRDLAYLQWAVAARHWILLVLATELFVPRPEPFLAQVATLAGALPTWCVVLAVVETTQAKMRVLRVPVLIGTGAAICLLALISWHVRGGA